MATEWTRNGDEEVGPFLKFIDDPDLLARDLEHYQDAFSEFGESFTLEMFIKLYEVRSKALLAKAIYDLPEYTMDQLFKAFNSGQVFKIEGNLTIDNE